MKTKTTKLIIEPAIPDYLRRDLWALLARCRMPQDTGRAGERITITISKQVKAVDLALIIAGRARYEYDGTVSRLRPVPGYFLTQAC